ncbi:MAG: serine/threonine protein kinase, partial [Myxococcales bacterium]|nr:serine/threonine protein kinase [Myxococcales bacterium]
MVAGRFRCTAWLGTGGVADVFEAVDLRGGATVAVKCMRSRLRGDARVDAHYQVEAGALRRLAAAPVAHLVDEGVGRDGLRYLVLERLWGPSFDACVAAACPTACGLATFAQLLDVVERIHGLGVVHGDLKPGNAILVGGDAVALIDFGLAVVDDDAAAGARPHVFGTPEYMAPELIDGASRSVASDVYALGAMLYELLTGAPPFGGRDAREIARRVLDDDVVPVSRRVLTPIAPALDALVLKALARRPEDRFASVAALRDALRAAPV